MRAPPLLLALFGSLACVASAASLNVAVKDDKGNPVADAVVYAMPKKPEPSTPRGAAIEQKDKTFIPLVTVVQVGTPVSFPNHDIVRHHVYSFSPPKPFELKLYVGTPVAPVIFDKPGEVVLGCNIHDHMLAYVYVVDTPFFAKTNASGSASIDELPAGDYDLQLWHYAQATPQASQSLKIRGEEKVNASFAVPLRAMPPRPAPKP